MRGGADAGAPGEGCRLMILAHPRAAATATHRAAEIAGRIYSAISPRFFRDRMAAPAASATEIPMTSETGGTKN